RAAAVKFLLPSEIRFFSRVKNWSELASEERLTSIDLTAYAKKLMSHDSSYPKLQVAQLNGRWFALNSLQLAICRHLERSGYCRRIRVTVCPPQALPEQVAKGLQLRRSRGEDRSSSSKDGESASLAAGSSSSSESEDDFDNRAGSDDDGSCSEGDFDNDDQNPGDASCSGSDSYCSECEREAREAASEAEKKPACDNKQSSERSVDSKVDKTKLTFDTTPVTTKAAAGKNPAPSTTASKEAVEDSPSLDRDLADLGPTTAMLLQQLDIKEAAAAAAAAAMRDRDQEREALI
uniref:SWIB domain-containing protein n=1 Tax=Macrostomum lignano TaxID=282301 RepID=A0A1I8FUX9_9PLAT